MEDMRPGLRHGDLTTTGGVITATGRMRFHGKEMAAEGDLATCPACKSVGYLVNDAYPAFGLPSGRQLAIQGAWIFCKCANPPRAIASTDKFRVAVNRMNVSDAQSQSSTHTAIFDEQFLPNTSQAACATASAIAPATHQFDDRFVLCDANAHPFPRTAYAIRRENGLFEYGETDDRGRTHLLSSVAIAERVQIYLAG
ncbi:hypothetical protein R20233_01720 [Ralstonia sp. LMG 32965]|uniref:PAAR domain-containing protein n=1 Tax=Ralstonia flatus TaxID=3058601 RepID=UPI0028F621AA|nr:PAAR domain-containing protein [Ralstonia sp. LMG 32965]CAJ0870830.1 hypothetical protein R20233_01720 [Ralstonia sp. LMG 32965]